MALSFRVMKEPRGFIRVIQCLMAIFAFSTTAGFTTRCIFTACGKESTYNFGYPFSHTEFEILDKCGQEEKARQIKLPFSFTTVSSFFVCTGVLSFLYTLGILVVYICFKQSYTDNPKVPVVDLVINVILSNFWLAASSAWAQGVGDLRQYLHPDTVFQFLSVCRENGGLDGCKTVQNGSYGVLSASVILGFANFALWVCSTWFIYKETVFHTELPTEPVENPRSVGSPAVTRNV